MWPGPFPNFWAWPEDEETLLVNFDLKLIMAHPKARAHRVWTTFPVPSLRSATGFEFTCEWLVKKRRKFYAPGGLSPQNRGEPLMWSGNETSLKTSLVPRPFPPPGFDRLQRVETAHCKRSVKDLGSGRRTSLEIPFHICLLKPVCVLHSMKLNWCQFL